MFFERIRNRLRESFLIKVLNAFALSILILSALFMIFFIYYQKTQAKRDLVDKGRMLAGFLSRSSRTGVFAENVGSLRDLVRGVMEHNDEVLAVTIYSTDKVLFSEHKNGYAHESVQYAPITGIGKDVKYSDMLEMREDSRKIEFLKPVVLETALDRQESLYFDTGQDRMHEEFIGYIKITLDKAALSKRIATVLFRSALIAVAFLIFGSVILFFAVRRVTSPLARLADSVVSLGNGETVEDVPVESSDEIGRLAGSFNSVARDLRKREAEKVRLEEQLRHAQKMEAVGTLARGVAHDFNNILTTVQGALYILKKKLEGDETVLSYIDQMSGSLWKLKKLVNELLIFSRTQAVRLAPLDLNRIVKRAEPMLSSMAGDRIEVRIELSEGKLPVVADADQLERILMNLCANGRDAMPDGGVLTVCTSAVRCENGKGKPGTGWHGVLTVNDTGGGMIPDVKERAFEPFFTTKEVGKGTGLGLSIVYGIVEMHNGIIELDTRPGKGTIFRISLPLVPEEQQV